MRDTKNTSKDTHQLRSSVGSAHTWNLAFSCLVWLVHVPEITAAQVTRRGTKKVASPCGRVAWKFTRFTVVKPRGCFVSTDQNRVPRFLFVSLRISCACRILLLSLSLYFARLKSEFSFGAWLSTRLVMAGFEKRV